MTKKTGIRLFFLVFAVILSACSSNVKDSNTKEEKKNTAASTQTTEKKDEETTKEAVAIEKEGVYVGQIDNNSIEIESEGEILVLRLTDEVRETIAALKDGATVSFIYIKDKNDQNMLQKITALDSGSAEQPTTKTLEYTVGESKIQKEASLTNSEQDYSFYKVDEFEFTAEEPQKDLLFASEFAETFVRIEPLTEDASIDDLKKWANDELEALDDVKEVNGSEVAGPAFDNTELFITSTKDSFKKYIVIQTLKSGDLMKYTVNLPKHNKAVEWEQAIWAMLSTLENE